MLLPNLSCVCIPCFRFVVPRVYLTTYYILTCFRPGINTEMGVVIYMYLKHSSDYIDSKYVLVHESHSIGSSAFAEISFLAFSTKK